MLRVLPRVEKEIARLPLEIREALADCLALLREGLYLSMPLSRPLPSIGSGVHEIRLNGRSGTYRIFYVILNDGEIYLLCATQKKTQNTPKQLIQLVKQRLRSIR